MHSSQFGITFTDSRGPVNSDGPIHCIRSLNRMVRYSVMPVCEAISSHLHLQSQDNDNNNKDNDNKATAASHVDKQHGDSEVTETRPKKCPTTCFGPLVIFSFFFFHLITFTNYICRYYFTASYAHVTNNHREIQW